MPKQNRIKRAEFQIVFPSSLTEEESMARLEEVYSALEILWKEGKIEDYFSSQSWTDQTPEEEREEQESADPNSCQGCCGCSDQS